MKNREKTVKLLESFLSDKEVDGVCGYMVDPDGEGPIQVIVVLDIDYIQEANTKPGFIAKMIREGVKQEIKKWIGFDVYVGSTAKKCENKSISESMSPHVRRRLDFDVLKQEINNIVDYELSVSCDSPVGEFIGEACDMLNERVLDDIVASTNVKVSLKEKDELYFYLVNTFGNYLAKKYKVRCADKISESKKKYVVTESQLERLKEYFDPIHYLKKIMNDAPKYIRDPQTLKYDAAFQKVVDVIFKYTMKHSPVGNLKGVEVTKVTPQGWGSDMKDDSKGSHTEWIVLLNPKLPKWFNPDDIDYRTQLEDFKKEFVSIANMMGLTSTSPISQEGYSLDKVKFIINNN